MIAQTKGELAAYRKGVHGSLQRRFRMIFQIVRMNSLGRRPQMGGSLAEVEALVLDTMRRDSPDFSPDIA